MMQDRLLRLRAEFDNYRKRETRDKRASWERAKGDLLKKLLPSLDDLHRVAAREPLLLLAGQRAGVDAHAALGAAQR